MTELLATKPDWLPKITELVGRYSQADADACETICGKIAQWHGPEAEARARELFLAQRARQLAAKLGKKAAAQAPAKVDAPAVASPEPKAAAKAEVKPQPKPERVADAALVLNPSSPYDTAGEFIYRRCMLGDHCILWFWQDQFYRWGGRVYEPVSEKALEGQLYEFLDKAVKSSGGGHGVGDRISSTNVDQHA